MKLLLDDRKKQKILEILFLIFSEKQDLLGRRVQIFRQENNLGRSMTGISQ